MKKLKRPVKSLRLSLDLPVSGNGFHREVLPFRRSWAVTGIVAIVDLLFLVPAAGAFAMASDSLNNMSSLMDLVALAFSSAWLLGWSIAPLMLTLLLAVLMFGREVIRVSAGKMELGIGLPGLMVFVPYELAKMQELRLVTPEKRSGTSWRGRHLAFDYDGYQIDMGSMIDEARMAEISAILSHLSERSDDTALADPSIDQTQTASSSDSSVSLHHQAPIPAPLAQEDSPEPASSFYTSIALLVLMNLIPIFGWWQWGWHLSDVMVLYWAESAIIGFYNLFKMAVIGKWLALFSGPFFLGHFGGFMAVHFMFIYTIFVQGLAGDGPGDSLEEVTVIFTNLWPALLGLFISHSASFYNNFIGRKEYLGKTLKEQMKEPYSRILFMHVVLIFGGMLAMALGNSAPVVLMVILLKIGVDILAHLKQRRVKAVSEQATVATT